MLPRVCHGLDFPWPHSRVRMQRAGSMGLSGRDGGDSFLGTFFACRGCFTGYLRHSRNFHSYVRDGDVGADFVYYDPWLRRKVSAEVAAPDAIAMHDIQDDVSSGWVHHEDENEWSLRDRMHNYTTPPDW